MEKRYSVFRKTAKFLAWFLVFLLILPLILVISLHIPVVQDYAKNAIVRALEEKLNTKVEVGKIGIGLWKDVSIHAVYVEDQHKDTLLYAEDLSLNISLVKLLGKEIFISNAELDNAYLNMYRLPAQEDFNYTFIAKAFEDSTASTSPWNFHLESVSLEHVRLNYDDVPGGMSMNSSLASLDVDIQQLGLEDNHLILEEVTAEGLILKWTLQEPTLKNTQTTNAPEWTFTINQLALSASGFQYQDQTKTPVKKGMDFNDLNFSNIDGSAKDIVIKGNAVAVAVNNLSLLEKSGFQLKDLKGKMDMSEEGIALELSKLLTPQSKIDHSVFMVIPLQENADIGGLAMKGNLKDEKLAVQDMAYFLPSLDTLSMLKGKSLSLSGKLKGTLNDFSFSNAKIALDKQTHLNGDLSVKGLPQWKTAYVHANVDDLCFSAGLLKPFINEQKSGIKIATLGNVFIKGKIKGEVTNPTINLSANTVLGSLALDMKLRTDTSFKSIAYTGNISTADLNLNKIIEEDVQLGKVSMNGFLSGRNDQVSQFNGNIQSAEFRGYTYQKITVSGSMIDQRILADVKAEDKSVQANLDLDLSLKSKQYAAKGTIAKLDLFAIGFMDNPLTVSASLNGDLQGNTADSLTGFLSLADLKVSNDTSSYRIDSLGLSASLDNGNHTVSLQMPGVSASISGRFSMRELPVLAKNIWNSYQDPFYKNEPVPDTKSLQVEIQTGEVGELAGMILPEISRLDSVHVHLRFQNPGQKIELISSVNQVSISEKRITGIFLNASGEEREISFKAGADKIQSGKDLLIDKALLSGELSERIIHLNAKLYEQTASTRVNMDGILRMSNDSLYLTLPSAEIVIQNKKWDLSKGNSITYAKNYLSIEDLKLVQGEQEIIVNSKVREGSSMLTALLHHVELNEVGELAGMSSYGMSGEVNGKVLVSDPLGSQGIDANMTIDSFGLNNVQLGHLDFLANKEREAERVSIDASLRGISNRASASGYFSLAEKGQINMNIHISELALAPWEPFVETMIFRMEGKVKGDFKITGNTSSPQFAGTLHFPGTNRIGVNLSQTVYKVQDQQIVFTESAIVFNRFVLRDSLNNEAVANGKIFYSKGFQELNFDMKLHADRFELINSPMSPDAAFYGLLYANMNVVITGPLTDLNVDLNMRTQEGSRLFLPLATAEPEAAIPGYIHFDEIEPINAEDTLVASIDSSRMLREVKLPDIDYTRFHISGDLRVTQETEMNIIVDPMNGDKITATGNGRFSFSFNSQNELDLNGTYTIEEGNYQFSFVNLVKKNFILEKGSTISWSGDFENADLNITAYYETRTSRFELVADQADFMTKDQIAVAKRPLPVKVFLYMKGDLMAPEISFNIEIPEGGDVLTGNLVTQEISQINNNSNEQTKQVFSIIVLNKFLPENATNEYSDGNNIALNEVNQSVSRLLNSQLNKLSDDYLKGVDISVSLQSLDQSYGQFAQNAEVSVSKQISDRITVSAGGNVNINSSYGSNQFAGDYNVFYQLNSSGTVNLKFFRTSTQNFYTNHLNTQTGFSVNLRREFNRWSRLFFRRKEEGTIAKEEGSP